MKLVKCKITLHNAKDYTRVIDALLFAHLAHIAEYSPPVNYRVTVVCSHVNAERNLSSLLEGLQLQCEKESVSIDDGTPKASSRIADLQGPPAPISFKDAVFLVSPTVRGTAS